ncbi:MAG: YbaB/EbfC family nucleoid-associated protein [Aeoliella sp.]
MLKGLGALGNIGNIMKQAQEMGGKMQALTEELKTKRATGMAGGGMVEVEVNGAGEVLAVRIDPKLTDREMLEDLLPAAFNAAKAKAQELHQQAMQELTGEMNLPGLGDALENLGGS